MKNRFFVAGLAALALTGLGIGRAAQADPVGDRAQITATLRAFYPNLGDGAFQAKLDGATDAFHFFRTFAPYYYWLLKQSPPLELRAGGAENFGGWCVGDAHLENFGAVLDPSGHAAFAMNDLDDGGPCPLYADFLRFLVSAELSGNALQTGPLVARYVGALGGEATYWSAAVRKLLEKGEGESYAGSKLLDGSDRLARGKGNSEVSAAQKSAVTEALGRFLGEAPAILDMLVYVKESGGSGGVPRFRVLVDASGKMRKAHEDRDVIELKGIETPAIAPLATAAIPAAPERFARSVAYELGAPSRAIYSVVSVLGEGMQARHLWKGDRGVSISDYGNSELADVAGDEAATLGKLHRQSADDAAAYARALGALSPDDWKAAVGRVAAWINEAYLRESRAAR